MLSLKVWLKSYVLYFWFFGLIYLYHAWFGERKYRFRVQVLPSLWVVFFYYTFGFPLSWTTYCFSAEPWIDFLGQTLHGWLESTFLWLSLLFLPNYGLFWTKSAKNMEKEWSYQKINAIFGLSTLKHLLEYQLLFIIWESNFWHLKNIALT